MIIKIIIVILLITFITITKHVSAALRINEIYPAPEAGELEWVEIYNDEDKLIDLSSYILTDATSKKIKFSADSLSPFGFTIATASSGVLNNNDGDTVILKNNINEVIESISYSGGFNSEKSYIRCLNGGSDWFLSTNITKNASNETACTALTPTPTPTPTAAATPTPHPTSTPTPTLSPTPSVSTSATITINPTKLVKNIVTPVSINQSVPSAVEGLIEITPEEEILGETTENKDNNKSLIKKLALISLFFSLLTIITIFLKIKSNGQNT